MNLDRPALCAFPSITFCNWPGVFSGQPPNETGSLGNAFFERDRSAGKDAPDPLGSSNKKRDLLDNFQVTRGALNERTRDSSESLYDKVNTVVSDPLLCVSINTFYSKSDGKPGLKVKRLTYPGWPLRRLSTYFAWPVMSAYREYQIAGHDDDAANKLDEVSGADAIRQWKCKDEKVPDITSQYFPGPDNAAHAAGGPIGAMLLPKIKQHFESVTDLHFGRFLEHLEHRGYQYATVFALTADHGLIGFTSNDRHQLTIEDDAGRELERLFDPTVGGLDGPKLWRGSKIKETSVVFSPNGGMAHLYIKGQNWSLAPDLADVEAVAHLIHEEAVGKAQGQIVGDLKDALGSPPAIFVRTNDTDSKFNRDYKWLYKDANGIFRYGNIQEFQAQRQDASAWPEFSTRLNHEFNDKGTRPEGSSRSGDIVLIMDVQQGFLTCIHGDEYPGWHGGPTEAEAKVPLIFNFLGANKDLITNSLPTGNLRNWHMTPTIVNIMSSVR